MRIRPFAISALNRRAAVRGDTSSSFPAIRPPKKNRRTVNPKLSPADRYTPTSNAHAVRKATKKAGVPHWHPNQLRHLFATEVRKAHGLEAAQVLLGHSRADVTQVYAERNLALAARVAKEIG